MSVRQTLLLPSRMIFLLLVCMILSFSLAFRFVKQELDQYRRTRASLTEIQELAANVSTERSVLDIRYGGPALDLEKVVGETLLSKVQVERNEPALLAGEMRQITARLRFQHLRWDQIRDLMTRLETSIPPWRIEALSIESGLTDLSGSLDLVALEQHAEE